MNDPHGTCACGDIVEGTVALDANLSCGTGDAALKVDAGAELNLNGFAITCTESGYSPCGTGVKLLGANSRVRGSISAGGRILGFATGVDGQGYTNTVAGPRLTVADNGNLVSFGIYNVAKVEGNLIIGAAAAWAGNAISAYSSCVYVKENIVTDSVRGVALSGTSSSCIVADNRAFGNEVGFASPWDGTFNLSQSNDNVFLNNDADYWDIVSGSGGSPRLNPAKNVCQTTSGTYASCSLEGFSNP